MTTRLPSPAGDWIDRSKPVEFEFESRKYSGFEGDTVTSALLAAGVRVLGRSFKYHRPRGVLSMANHDINVLLQAGQRLNVRGDVEPLVGGLALTAVNTLGGVSSDRAGILDRLSPFLPVGFYYKAFYRPKWLAGFWEGVFRRLTGLGRLDFSTPHVRTPKRYDFCDVLVIGAGPSGLSAAIAAAEAGATVVVVDENAHPGGSLGYQRGAAEDASALLRALLARVAELPNISLRTSTLAAACYADHWVPLVDAQRLTKMRARAMIVAGGAYEQPAVFRNNDLPGVMLATAAQRLIYRYGVRPMQRALVLTANADGYSAALDLAAHGVEIAAIVDLNTDKNPASAAAEAVRRGIRVIQGYTVYEAQGDAGVASASVCPLLANGRPDASRAESIACDAIVTSVGYAPAAPLLYQAGTQMRHDEALGQFVPEKLPDGVFAAGRVNGVYDFSRRPLDGARAGRAAAKHLGFQAADPEPVARDGEGINHPLPDLPAPQGKKLHRLRRGPAAQGFRERSPGRLRQHRVDETIHHGRHGAEPGQAFEHECNPHPGAHSRPRAGRGRNHHGAALLSSGAAFAPGRARLSTRAADAHP
jgi:sarcosine oxidase, subunit alpha